MIDHLDRVTHIPQACLCETPPFPTCVKIEVTSRCNYACTYCPHRQGRRKDGDIDPQFYMRLIIGLVEQGAQEVGLFYLGEPMLNGHLRNYVELAKDTGIPYVFITTNGQHCPKRRAKGLFAAGLDSLKFSLNAPTRGRYRRETGVDAFDEVVQNIIEAANVCPAGRSVAVSMILDPEVVSQQKALAEHLRRWVDVYFLPQYNSQGFVDGVPGNPGRIGALVPPVPCWSLFQSTYVTWDGWMTACPFDYEGTHRIADLKETSLAVAWASDKYRTLRALHLSGELKGSLCARCLCL